MNEQTDIAAKKLYEATRVMVAKDRDWIPIHWSDLSEDGKEYYRHLVHLVRDNTPAPIDGEVRVRLPGMRGAQPILRIFRCDVTEEAINAECAEFRTWLMELTRNLRE